MEIKHGGCWYCAARTQPVLTAIQKQVIDKDGKSSTGGYALCDVCVGAPMLDQRIPMEQRQVR
jgi:radical SAM superfamily enzyme